VIGLAIFAMGRIVARVANRKGDIDLTDDAATGVHV
jgi:hypothetical protein